MNSVACCDSVVGTGGGKYNEVVGTKKREEATGRGWLCRAVQR